jgi:hypothetical protein
LITHKYIIIRHQRISKASSKGLPEWTALPHVCWMCQELLLSIKMQKSRYFSNLAIEFHDQGVVGVIYSALE